MRIAKFRAAAETSSGLSSTSPHTSICASLYAGICTPRDISCGAVQIGRQRQEQHILRLGGWRCGAPRLLRDRIRQFEEMT
jgi:hypothetical protein